MKPGTSPLDPHFKLGVLGGGQLGKMLALAAGNWHLPLYILDSSKSFPAGRVTPYFTEGNFKDFDDVYQFGRHLDVLTIEIEHVNTDALHQLEKEGVTIHPSPGKLDIIKDKGAQKLFYQEKGIPTAPFQLFENEQAVRMAIEQGTATFPFVQKSRTAGYDGRGVSIIRDANSLKDLLPGACLIEKQVEIDKELAVIVARNARGEAKAFPAVEMEFNPEANLVEFLFCPAAIPAELEAAARKLATEVAAAYDICGLLAVELFLDKKGQLLVNEVAPRTHNSGHHTIDSCYTSQFEQHLRAVLNFPLGSTRMKAPSVMVNLLGAEGHTGPAVYQGLEDCLAIEGVHVHLYGKADTKPFRKMGHVTIVDENLENAKIKARRVKELLQVVSDIK
ncbi:MAG: 5-(carboxyamino)imidazole ribonucleotide synthase [Lewinellaceae bacterium]|nr:5-(carboxyamino)imidazole ribonucleotide synthase [Phaeodactylibacter sp.]MCB0612369.1 5-(carboxyamino)imidazole ribonucleotide synthase [Phaeodactylibacter sp.]MCB9349515.1 5-(carboxyamino)imidazole ribonucleotide synthase [Lewinellaceae bacterium]